MEVSCKNLKEILSVRLSKAEVTELEIKISDSKELFDELVSIIIHGTHHQAFMASWVLQYAAIRQPDWFYHHLSNLLKRVENNPDETILRCMARVIWKTNIPTQWEGIIAHKCFGWIENKASSIAVKAFSLHILSKVIDHEPELRYEIRDVAESILPYASSGLANAAQKLLLKIRKWV